ncbi:beta-ketoacyl synthase N-terminal-like domain-containing protein [Streptomyces sp. AD16]|nr:beta-ketoacyl synthase N-terminal-like domain-containing protein [Streptomyces sp. AD16]
MGQSRQGHESVRPVSDEEFLAAGGDPEDLDDPSLIRMASVIEGIDRFDSGFFGYSPAEAAVVDPQQRLLLETAYHALEDAGHLGEDTPSGTTGVYAGSGDSRYYPAHVHPGSPGSPARWPWSTRPPPTRWARSPPGSPTSWA